MLVSIGLKSTEKKFTAPLNPVFFFKSLIVKPFEISWSLISKFYALNWYTAVALTSKKLSLSLYCRLKTNIFPDCVKLIGYFASAVNVVSSNPCVGPSPRVKISFSLLST